MRSSVTLGVATLCFAVLAEVGYAQCPGGGGTGASFARSGGFIPGNGGTAAAIQARARMQSLIRMQQQVLLYQQMQQLQRQRQAQTLASMQKRQSTYRPANAAPTNAAPTDKRAAFLERQRKLNEARKQRRQRYLESLKKKK